MLLYSDWFAREPWDAAHAMARVVDAVMRWPVQAGYPRADVMEHADAWEIVCDVPGMGPDEIEVTAANDTVVIRGTRRWDGGVSQFARSFWLGGATLSADASASLSNGVLRVRVPKGGGAATRVIPVRAGDGAGRAGGVLGRIREGFARSGRALARWFGAKPSGA